MSERQGIEIDCYPKCRGVWPDRGELDKIIERSAGAEAQAAPTQPYAPQASLDRRSPIRARIATMRTVTAHMAATTVAVVGGHSCRISSTRDVVLGQAQRRSAAPFGGARPTLGK